MNASKPESLRTLAMLFALGACALTALLGGCSKSSSGLFGDTMSVVAKSPAAGSSGASATTTIWVKFSAAIRENSVDSRSFRVEGSESGVATGTFALSENGRRVTFTPSIDSPFTAGETVTVTINSDLMGANGTTAKKHTFSFAIAGEDAEPEPEPAEPAVVLLARSPERNATGVPRDLAIELVFDAPLDPATVTAASIALGSDRAGRIPAELALSTDATRITLTPERGFHPGERVSVRLSRALQAAAGGSFGGETFHFVAASASAEPLAGGLARAPAVTLERAADAVLAADLDQDGVLDLVLKALDGSRVDILRGNGAGGFTPADVLVPTSSALSVALADQNGDGWLDILVGTNDRVLLYQIADDVDLLYGDPATLPVGAAVHAIVAGELDHQAVLRDDFILNTDQGLQVFHNGAGGAAQQVIGTVRLARTTMVLRDLLTGSAADPDGWLDLLFGTAAGDSVGLHAGAAGGLVSAATLALPSDARSVLAEDFDRDGRPDIVALVALPDGSEVVTFVAPHDTPAIGAAALALPALGASQLLCADMNGDGWLDLVLSHPETARVGVKLNDNGAIDLATSFATLAESVPVTALVAGDFDGDGKLDLVGTAGTELVRLLSRAEVGPTPDPVAIAVEDVVATQGDAALRVPLRLSNSEVLTAFDVILGYDPLVLTARDIDLAGTVTAAEGAAFTHHEIDADNGELAVLVVMDISPTPTRILPAGSHQLIARGVFDVDVAAPPGESAVSVLATGSLGGATRFETPAGPVAFVSTPGVVLVLEREPPPAEHVLTLGSVEAEPGAADLLVPVRMDNDSPIDAFTVIVGYDPTALSATGIEPAGGVTESLVLFFDGSQIDPEAGWISYNALFSPLVPDNVIPPGAGQLLFQVAFDVGATTTPGDYPLGFLDSIGPQSLDTILSSGGERVALELVPGNVRVEEPASTPTNALTAGSVLAPQGASGLSVEVRLTNESPTDQITVVLGFDPAVLEVTAIDTTDAATGALFPFEQKDIRNDEGYVFYDVLLKNVVLGGESLPPGSHQLLLKLRFRIRDDAPVGTHDLAFLTEVAGSTRHTRLLSNQQSMPLELNGGTVSVAQKPVEVNPNKLRVGDAFVHAGATDARIGVFMTANKDVFGFTATGNFDPSGLTLTGHSFDGTASEALEPEFDAGDVSLENGTFSFSAIFDLLPPFEGELGKHLDAGADARILDIHFDVPETAASGEYAINLFNEFGPDRPNSLIFKDPFTAEAITVFPELTGGTVVVDPPEAIFVRGDVDGSGIVDFADYTYLLLYLTRDGDAPLCFDAADANDSGSVNSNDLTTLLNHIFESQPIPPPTADQPGVDPTEDSLGCEVGL